MKEFKWLLATDEGEELRVEFVMEIGSGRSAGAGYLIGIWCLA